MKRGRWATIGIAIAACGVCLVGPILASIAALGLASFAGVAVFTGVALVVVIAGLMTRRSRRQACASPDGR